MMSLFPIEIVIMIIGLKLLLKVIILLNLEKKLDQIKLKRFGMEIKKRKN